MIPSNLLKSLPVARTKKLLDAARDYPCANCNARDGTIVAAHSNELALGRGFAHKTPDWLVAYLCFSCHSAVDGRSHGLSREDKRAMWHRAYCVTVNWWFRDGLIQVSSERQQSDGRPGAREGKARAASLGHLRPTD